MKKIFLIFLIFCISISTNAENLTYFGSNEICIKSFSGGETCLNNNDKTMLNHSQDYYIVLKNIEHEKSIKGVFNFASDHHQAVIRTVIIFIVLSLFGTLGFYYLRK